MKNTSPEKSERLRDMMHLDEHLRFVASNAARS
jgi:hypothetical protein